jgi:predicted Zn-dependent protease
MRTVHRPIRLVPLLVVAAGCATNPATGERQLSLIGEDQEVQMGREADQQIVASMGLYDDAAVQRYVSDLGARLAATSERPDLPWTFRVLDDPTVNAFALPGGFIYVTRGILTHLDSEAELAGVLGHEIGHVTARHSVNQMSRAQLAQLGLGIGMIFSETLRQFGDVAGAGMQLLFLKFGRDDESEADRLGIRYMTRESYDPRELSGVMEMLARSSQLQSGSGRVPEWLSTHPDPANRSQAILRMAEESGADYSNAVVARPRYLQRVDGMIFGANPREGYTEGGVFHHPDLEFRMAVPSGWQVVNGKTEVQFITPEQDGAVLLTLSEGNPADAMAAFAAQQGLSVGTPSSGNVNGNDAVSAPFEANTEQGVLAGEVMFLRYGGNTYRLLGVAARPRWASLAQPARSLMRSFQRETDAQVLAVRPDRVAVVEFSGALAFDSFLQRYPSVVEAPIVALINQVSEGGTLQDLGKRVVGS